ncbi:MAG: hypothetical protein QOF48_1766 [Verrucomicrobiota bacterium]|jgi:SAM-dependent methyltransferase
MAKREIEYVLGTEQAELERLGLQHQLWTEHTARGWERAGFQRGMRLMDVGCGPGFATVDLAERVGHRGKVVAIDISRRFLAHLQAQATARGLHNIVTALGSVEQLPISQRGFHGAYARWVLCFVRKPEAVVAGVHRRLRKGGVFLIHDYFRYDGITVAPQSEIFQRVFHAVNDSWRMRGGDPDIGCRLPALLLHAGFEVRDIRPIVRLARPGSTLWNWPDSFFNIYLPTLVKMRLIRPRDERAFRNAWAEWSRNPAAFFTTPPMVEIVAVKR